MKTPLFVLVLALAGCASAPPVGDVPASVQRPDFRTGDAWTYQVRDGYNGLQLRIIREQVRGITEDAVSMHLSRDPSSGEEIAIYARDGNPVTVPNARTALPFRFLPFNPALVFPLEVGRRWQQDFIVNNLTTGKSTRASLYGKVAGWEHISVPAGQFDALKIQRQIYLDDEEFWRWRTEIYESDWYVPAIKRFARHEDRSEFREKSGRWPNNIRRGDWTILELMDYRPAP